MKSKLIVFTALWATACATRDLPESGPENQASAPQEIPAVEEGVPMTNSREMRRQVFEKRELDNGLEVFAIPKPTIPMVTVMIAVRNGAFVETPDLDGLAHFYEHMFFKANQRYSSQGDFMAALDELGAELGPNMNAYTSTESVRYFFTIQSRQLDEGLDFMAQALIRPEFKQEELEKERQVILSELDMYDSDPSQSFFQDVVMKNLFSNFYSHKNIGGDREVIKTVTQEKMREIQSRFYVPNNSSIFVVGQFDPEVLWKSVEKHFGSKVWPEGKDPFVEKPVPEHPPLTESQIHQKKDKVQTVSVIQAYHGPSYGKDDRATIVFDLLSLLLSRETSIFQEQLVDSGLATSAYFYSWTQRHTSPLLFNMEALPEKAGEAAKKFQELIQKIASGGVFSQKDLEIAKTGIEARTAFDMEVGQRMALGLGDIWSSTGSLDYYVDYIEVLRSIELEEINSVVQTYLKDKPAIVAALLPESMNELDLRKP